MNYLFVFAEVKTGVLSAVSTINDEDVNLNVRSPPKHILAARKEENGVHIFVQNSNGENDVDTVR